MVKFSKNIAQKNREMFSIAFKLIKKYKDNLTNDNIQSFLEDHIDKIQRGRVSQIFFEGGINLFPKQENFICSNCLESSDILEIEIPKNIEIIGSYCFAYSSLEKISFQQGSKLRILSYGALQGTNIEEIILPEGFEHIDGLVFDSCYELKKIVLPNSLQSIGANAFKNCARLEELIFQGTQKEFYEVYKDKRWGEHSYINKVICTDGEFIL